MRSRFHALALLGVLVAPLNAQTTVETGGGMAHLDRFAGGAFSSFRGSIKQAYGPWQLAFMNTTVAHDGLGTAYRTDLNLRTAIGIGSWELNLGPQLHLARGIDLPATRTISADIGLQRDFGRWHFVGDVQRGQAWFGNQHNSFITSDLSLGTHRGIFKFGTTVHALGMTDSVPRTDVSFDLRDTRIDTLYRERVQRVTDVGVNLGMQVGRVTFAGQYGGRFGATTVGARTWWVGDVAVRVVSQLAITINGSQLPSDPLLRLHGGRYASLGLRLGGASSSKRVMPSGPADPLAVEVTRGQDGMVSVKFAIPGARNTASITGEFSSWQPMELTRLEDGRWLAIIKAAPGLQRMNIRADGGAWAVPPGLRSMADDFGGVVGLLVVPERK